MQRTYNPSLGFLEILGTQGWRGNHKKTIIHSLFSHKLPYYFHFIVFDKVELNKNDK